MGSCISYKMAVHCYFLFFDANFNQHFTCAKIQFFKFFHWLCKLSLNLVTCIEISSNCHMNPMNNQVTLGHITKKIHKNKTQTLSKFARSLLLHSTVCMRLKMDMYKMYIHDWQLSINTPVT